MSRPLVLSHLDPLPGWTAQLPDPDLKPTDAIPTDLGEYDSAWIDATRAKPLEVARGISKRDDTLQLVVVTPPEDRGIYERAMLFTPGLGEVWLTEPAASLAEMHERAREVTATRRRFQKTRHRFHQTMEGFSGSRSPRAIVSDAYLATLFQVLSDPVVSVDEDDRVVSWSDAAEQVLGIRRDDALGEPAVEVLAPEEPERLREALREGAEGTSRLELRLIPNGRRIISQTTITPVEAGGVRVRSILLRDVTQEREALEELQRSVEMRSKFYAAMSHEIRTPINSIMGYHDLLRSGAGADRQEEFLDRAQRAAHHLLELVNDVLDLSKLEGGSLQVDLERVPTGALVQELLQTVEPLAAEHETEIISECAADSPVVVTDERRVKQILLNLVSNALKFGEGKPIRIRCYGADGTAAFEVEDQGHGIPEKDLERVFEEFAQVEGTRGGTGLGLPISRKLAELLGGTLTVRSEVGKGSCFRLDLPVNREGPPAAPPPSAPP